MGERTADQPPRRAGSTARGGAVRLAGPVARGDVERVAAATSRALADCPPGIVDCDVGATDPPDLPTIDVLARIALAARRTRHDLRLEHASPAILELLALCGLSEVLRPAASHGRRGPGGRSGGQVVR